jgi:7,8-dihydropterin-6-yl-methyl-4-(beta-D-ribofuranosyl)aminobenzene 5'-phosphate synthase
VILAMVRRLSAEPLHAIVGGLHYPITRSRVERHGVQVQMIVGTGLPPWRGVTDEDLDQAIAAINEAGPRRVLLSAHDSCDHAIQRLEAGLAAEVDVLRAGVTYRL